MLHLRLFPLFSLFLRFGTSTPCSSHLFIRPRPPHQLVHLYNERTTHALFTGVDSQVEEGGGAATLYSGDSGDSLGNKDGPNGELEGLLQGLFHTRPDQRPARDPPSVPSPEDATWGKDTRRLLRLRVLIQQGKVSISDMGRAMTILGLSHLTTMPHWMQSAFASARQRGMEENAAASSGHRSKHSKSKKSKKKGDKKSPDDERPRSLPEVLRGSYQIGPNRTETWRQMMSRTGRGRNGEEVPPHLQYHGVHGRTSRSRGPHGSGGRPGGDSRGGWSGPNRRRTAGGSGQGQGQGQRTPKGNAREEEDAMLALGFGDEFRFEFNELRGAGGGAGGGSSSSAAASASAAALKRSAAAAGHASVTQAAAPVRHRRDSSRGGGKKKAQERLDADMMELPTSSSEDEAGEGADKEPDDDELESSWGFKATTVNADDSGAPSSSSNSRRKNRPSTNYPSLGKVSEEQAESERRTQSKRVGRGFVRMISCCPFPLTCTGGTCMCVSVVNRVRFTPLPFALSL